MPYRHVLITGCSKGGIGSALASEFQRAGLKVFATARNTAKVDPELADLPNVEVLQLDTTSLESIAAAVKTVDAKLDGRLDILINNAGQGLTTTFLDADIDDVRRLFEVNFFSLWTVAQAFMPLLLKAKGLLVNHASIAGYIAQPYAGFYGASKAAVASMSETMRLELAPLGVKVATLNTGTVKTEFFQNVGLVKLPQSSLYKAASDEFTKSGNIMDVGQPAQLYSKRVVSDILGGATGLIWRGKFSTTIKWLNAILPTFIQDRILLKDTGLDKVT